MIDDIRSSNVERFVPGRLQMARQARVLRQKDLAALVGRAAATLSKWENPLYDHQPDAEAIDRLSMALGVTRSWFYKPMDSGRAAFFRSLKTELVKVRERTQARLSFIEAIDEALREYVDFPEVDLPDFGAQVDFRHYRREHIEHFARSLREHWGLADEPIYDLVLLIENAGVIVGEDVLGSEKLDGVSQWSAAGRPYVLLAKDKSVGARRRFDAAHELGHLVLHRGVTTAQLRENFVLIEEQAMAFAGAFLMPASSFGHDISSLSLDALAGIKLKWGVSIGAMIKRLSALEFISSDYERNLWKYYSFRKWRGFEPLDDEIPVEVPENLRSAVEMLVSEGVARKDYLVEACGIGASDVEDLCGLTPGFLSPDPENLVRLRIPPRQPREGADDRDNVVPLNGGRK